MSNRLKEIESQLDAIPNPLHQQLELKNTSSMNMVDSHNEVCKIVDQVLTVQKEVLGYLMLAILTEEEIKDIAKTMARGNSTLRTKAKAFVAEGERYVNSGQLTDEPTRLIQTNTSYVCKERGCQYEEVIKAHGVTLPTIDNEEDALKLLAKCGYRCRCVVPSPEHHQQKATLTFPCWCNTCSRVVSYDPDEREETIR